MISKRSTIILLLLLALIAGGIFYWNQHKKRIVRNEVSKTVSDKTNNLYSIDIGKMEMDEVAGNLSVKGLILQPDSNIYNQLLLSKDTPAMLIRVIVPELSVAGVKTPKALLNNENEGRKVLIRSPRIELLYTDKTKDTIEKAEPEEIYKQILGNLTKIELDTVSIENATVVTRNWKTGEVGMQFDSVYVDLYRVAVDSVHQQDSNRLFFAAESKIRCSRIGWTSKNKLYKFQIRNIEYHSTGKQLSISSTSIDPQLPEAAFLRKFKTQTDRFDFSFKSIRVVNLDAPALLDGRGIFADSLVVGQSKYLIYRDLGIPRDKKSRVGTYPHQLLRNLAVDVRVKKALFTNAFIEYKERNPKSQKSGRVQFHNVTVKMDNVTNVKKALADNSILKLQFNSNFLGKVPVHALINFYTASQNGKFTIDGEMGSMPATNVNILTEPMGMAKIDNGTIRKLNFSFTGTDYRADGPVTLLYDDLKIALLKKDTADNKLEKKTFASFVANIKVKNANPGKDGTTRKEDVHYERDTNRSFFNLVWKSIFTGVKQTVGIE